MMEHAPRVHDVKATQALKIIAVKDGSLFDLPIRILRKVPLAQFQGASYRLGIVIEGMYARAEMPRGQAEQSASTTDIQECLVL